MSLLTKNISFCEKVAQNVVDENYKKHVLNTIRNFGAGVIQKHHERWCETSLQKLQRNPFLVCQRSNGNPYYMFLCHYNCKNVCIFIDKKVQSGYSLPRMIVVPFQFAPPLYNGTLLDGEMVKTTDNEWAFVVNTMYAYKGQPLQDTSLLHKLDAINNMLECHIKPLIMDTCHFQVKKYFKCTELNGLIAKLIPALHYTSRGLLFKPLYSKFNDILYNFDDSLIKNPTKRKMANGFVASIDMAEDHPTPSLLKATPKHHGKFRIAQTGNVDCYKLIDPVGKSAGLLRVRKWKESLIIQDAFRGQPITKELVIECEWNDAFQRHEFLKLQAWGKEASCS
eukprot:gene19641-26327_t